nr:immunoglobulin light chain junction region [Macaca mulatta]
DYYCAIWHSSASGSF